MKICRKLKDILNDNNIEYTLPKLKVKSLKNNNKTKYYYEIDGYIDYSEETENFVNDVLSDSDKLFRFLFGDSMIVTGNYDSYEFNDRMRDSEGEEVTEWGSYLSYGYLKEEFNNYNVYMMH